MDTATKQANPADVRVNFRAVNNAGEPVGEIAETSLLMFDSHYAKLDFAKDGIAYVLVTDETPEPLLTPEQGREAAAKAVTEKAEADAKAAAEAAEKAAADAKGGRP